MFKRTRLIAIVSLLAVLFAFKHADDYFEISKNLEIFSMVYKTVNSDYVEDVNPGELMRTGIDAMLNSLDPYTVYYNETQSEDAMIQQSGEYGGVGCRSEKIGDYVYITMVSKGLPADLGGLRIGDKILEINGKSMKGLSHDEIGQAIKGAPNTKAEFQVERQGKSLNLTLVRQEIKTKNVTYSGMYDNSIGYIKLDHFMMGAGAEVRDALISLKKTGANKIILDLRDNGGGLLHEAVNIVNVFVPSDKLVVVSKGRAVDAFREYKTLNQVTDDKIPLVVLVNERSASASEIVCGSLQDLDRAVIVGRNTFGKGLVQNVKPLQYRTQMKVTIAKYYIPSGRCIQLLDYGKKDAKGKPTIVPDSLRKKFKTSSGRTVLDGGGVRPDLLVDLEKIPGIVQSLDRSHIIFDFANQFRNEHENIDIKNFEISNELFNEFKTFAASKTFSYLNESETALKNLREKLASEKFDQGLTKELTQLEESLKNLKLKEMDNNKSFIIEKLLEEIVKRYHYEEGLFLLSFRKDPDILKSASTLQSPTFYNLLKP